MKFMSDDFGNRISWNILNDYSKLKWLDKARYKQQNLDELMGEMKITDPDFVKHHMFDTFMDIIGWKEEMKDV